MSTNVYIKLTKMLIYNEFTTQTFSKKQEIWTTLVIDSIIILMIKDYFKDVWCICTLANFKKGGDSQFGCIYLYVCCYFITFTYRSTNFNLKKTILITVIVHSFWLILKTHLSNREILSFLSKNMINNHEFLNT